MALGPLLCTLLFRSTHRFRTGDLIFELIWTYVLDYWPAGRSTDNSVLVSWQGQPDTDLKFPGISWRCCQGLWRKNSPTTSQNLHHTYIQVIFRYRYSSFNAKPTLSVGCQKAQFSFHLTMEHGSSQSFSSVSQTAGTYVVVKWQKRLFFSGMPSK